MTNSDIVQKLWNLCDVLRDDGIKTRTTSRTGLRTGIPRKNSMSTKRLTDLLSPPYFNPTLEQLAIRQEAATGKNLVVKAYAGTGKTAVAVDTAQFIKRRGRMIMFNASARKDAAARMPPYINPKGLVNF